VLLGPRLAAAYVSGTTTERYHCNYRLNPSLEAALTAGPLCVTARDDRGEARALELNGHPFFVATLFQPERAALEQRVPPIVAAFVGAAAAHAARGVTAPDRQ